MNQAADFGRLLEGLIEQKVREAVDPLHAEVARLRAATSGWSRRTRPRGA